ncbi:HNH endonuclease [Treponema zuelzerae]|uniref:HNH endonuclease n=1 Tax=Teretinema zuelzerae TaxID=156 RepID=A0AAE3EL53_9SPIR|nr:HNH endonuclease [Teretinema zuelzerae]MCD1655523.1 HNH endonuclease [Teretinema zuelzerae]
MNNDYRLTKSCPQFCNIKEKKQELTNKIKREHPRCKNMYNKIHLRKENYYHLFSEIYNHRCAYCGASTNFSGILLFEIDHFICESSFSNDTKGKAEAGKTSNLIFSCYTCNREKGQLHITQQYFDLLNPDNGAITNIFFRDELFNIKISERFQGDKFINDFHSKLLLGNQIRRLDYLLLEIQQLVDSLCDDSEYSGPLYKCINLLIFKKNNMCYPQ